MSDTLITILETRCAMLQKKNEDIAFQAEMAENKAECFKKKFESVVDMLRVLKSQNEKAIQLIDELEILQGLKERF